MMKLGNTQQTLQPQVKLDRIGLVCKLGCSLTENVFCRQQEMRKLQFDFDTLVWNDNIFVKHFGQEIKMVLLCCEKVEEDKTF